MIKAIANKKVDISDDEYKYFLSLEKTFGPDEFISLFSTDNDGNIVTVTPPLNKQVPMAIIFFLLNLSFNQRLRMVERWTTKINNLEERLAKLEGSK